MLPLDLTLQQQFELAKLQIEIADLPIEDLRAMLITNIKHSMLADVKIRQLLKDGVHLL